MPEDLLTSLHPQQPARSLDDLLGVSGNSEDQSPFVDAPERFVLMISGSPGDAQRYRCSNKAEEFEYLGLSSDSITSEQADYERDLGRYEMFLLHRVQNSPKLERFIQRARALGKPVIFDTDDLAFDLRPGRLSPVTRYMKSSELRLYKDYVYRTCRTLEQCDAAIVSTERLHDSIKELFPERTVYIHRDAASRKFLELVETVRSQYVRPPSDLIRIAYVSGSKTHKDDFAQCVRPLRRLLQAHPKVRLMAVGHVEIPAEVADLSSQVEAVPPVPWYQVPMCYAMVDINLAPRELNNPFAESKSELKYFEPALMEIPTVASDIAPFRAGIRAGETGFLCANDDQWYEALERLVLDVELRVRIGKAAKADVLARYTTKARSESLRHILHQIIPSRVQ